MTIKLRNGIFLAPFHPVDEDPTLCIQRDLELVDHLDRLGYDEAWIGEHHSAGFEIISSPELFIAAAAERTRRIKLGTGVVSLPYHSPLMAANRIIQLDHQTRGRVMFGVGPGLLPSDAFSMGIEPATQRDRMVEAIEVILRLWKGERVTLKTDWFNLVDATCQLKPYTWPHPEIAVASSVTPSGGKLAGRHGFGMLCVAATQAGGYDALAVNWAVANKTAAEHGKTMDPEKLRLVGPVHIAETREQAFENCKYGFDQWRDYFSGISAVAGRETTENRPLETLVQEGVAVVGTPDDAIAQIKRLQEKQGEFGVMLNSIFQWTDSAPLRRSLELYQRYVWPHFDRGNTRRQASYDWVIASTAEMSELRNDAVRLMYEKHARERAAARATAPPDEADAGR